ncbi:MAG: sigma-70 family RNA polymerase sigma factor [Planctomycetota bacterium]
MQHVPELTQSALAHHADFVRALARSLVRDPNEADDLEQETWLTVLRGGGGREPGRPWLAGVLRRTAFARRRADRRRARRERGVARAEGEEASRDLGVHQRVVAAVLALEEPYRAAVLLRYYRGWSVAEIADEQGVPVETVRTRLRRARSRLRETLDREYGSREAWVGLLAPLAATSTSLPAVAAASVAALVVGGLAAGSLLVGPRGDAESQSRTARLASPEETASPEGEAGEALQELQPPAAPAASPASGGGARRAVGGQVAVPGDEEGYLAALAAARARAARFDPAHHQPAAAALLTRVESTRLAGFELDAGAELSEVLDAIGTLSGVRCSARYEDLGRIELHGAVFRYALRRPLGLAALLDLVAADAGDGFGWYPTGEGVEVCFGDVEPPALVAFAHPLGDLLVDPREHGLACAEPGSPFAPPSPDELADLVRRHVAPGLWEAGGVSLEADADALHVRHSLRVHLGVQALLDRLRAFYAPPAGEGAPGSTLAALGGWTAAGSELAERMAAPHAWPEPWSGPLEELVLQLGTRVEAGVHPTKTLRRELGREPRFEAPAGESIFELLRGFRGPIPDLRWSVVGELLDLGAVSDARAPGLLIVDVRGLLTTPPLQSDDLEGTAPELARYQFGEPLREGRLTSYLTERFYSWSWDENRSLSIEVVGGALVVHQRTPVLLGIRAEVERLVRAVR